MRALGAGDAVNLDGGGSTTMTIRGAVVTRPSEATGERPVGDAILLLAGRTPSAAATLSVAVACGVAGSIHPGVP
jgi:hypothetical protein